MKLKTGERYEVYFYDHSNGDCDVDETRCRIIGYLVRETKRYFVFTSWEIVNDDYSKPDNYQIIRIFKKGITDAYKLERRGRALR